MKQLTEGRREEIPSCRDYYIADHCEILPGSSGPQLESRRGQSLDTDLIKSPPGSYIHNSIISNDWNSSCSQIYFGEGQVHHSGSSKQFHFRRLHDTEGDNTLGKRSTTLLSQGKKEPNLDTTQINYHKDRILVVCLLSGPLSHTHVHAPTLSSHFSRRG